MIKALLYEEDRVAILQRELRMCREFYIAAAAISSAGIAQLMQALEACLKKGGKGKVLFGIDLPSSPEAIEALLDVADRYPDQLLIKFFRPLKTRIFHPKLFVFRRAGKSSAVVGSSNWTQGGLIDNYEVNVLLQEATVISQLQEYFDQMFEGAYSSYVTGDWLFRYRREWARRKTLLDRVRRLQLRSAARRLEVTDQPKRIKGCRLAFTGTIPEWPRERKLYPLVKKLGGTILRAKQIATADCLIQGEIMGSGETQKLRGARMFNIPVLTEDAFWGIVNTEQALRRKRRAT